MRGYRVAALSISMMLLASACGGAVPPASQGPSASATSERPTPSGSSSLGQAQASGSVSAAPASPAGTAAKKEEATESTPPSGEEGAEGPPTPNALAPVPSGGSQDFAPVPGIDLTKNGAAVGLTGSVAAGQAVFAQNCVACHGAQGKGGIPNTGSDDGTVPPLNPIDPAFAASAKGNRAAFAREIDVFIQHGSRPSGPNPALSMIAWGDHDRLSQQQIADVEAYLAQLNGVPSGAGS